MTTLKLTALAGAAGLALAAASAQAQTKEPNLTGKWINATPMVALKTKAGATPPLNDKGKAEYAKNQANKKNDPINECLMHGEPRLLYTKYPFLIMQYDKHVDFLHEANHTFRITYFGEKPEEEPDPLWLGHPTASWKGKTLVIAANGYNGETWLDYSGLPHGEKLTTEEHYTLSADGKTINGEVTITDPEYYSQPWTTAFTLKKLPGYALEQYACMEDHKM